jgi:hypothetical protein
MVSIFSFMRRSLVIALFTLLLFSCKKTSYNLLIEAESFPEKGGWVVDPQFVEQMGSPYLLAHGLGNPVSDASTQVRIPEPGIIMYG